MSNLMDQLRDVVNNSEWTDRQLARETDIDHTAIYRFRTGERGLPAPSLEILAEAVGYEIVLRKRRGKRKAK